MNITEKVLQRHATVEDIDIAYSERRTSDKIIVLASSMDSGTFSKIKSIIESNPLSGRMRRNVIISNERDEYQVFSSINLGTNGLENSIKNSMIEVVNCLNKLESNKYVKWASITDVGIDILDDLYSYVVTFTLKKNNEKLKK